MISIAIALLLSHIGGRLCINDGTEFGRRCYIFSEIVFICGIIMLISEIL